MTPKEKQLLLKVICTMLPYGVKYQDRIDGGIHILSLGIIHHYDRFIPYLRPMSSMTEEEENEYNSLNAYEGGVFPHTEEAFDWLNAHHFDYHGLIEKGLALEAKEGMYKTE